MEYKRCKKCGESKELGAFRNKWHKGNQKYYRLTTCIACERIATKKHQEANRDKWREYNNKAYLNKVGSLRWVLNRTPEDRRQRALDKANRRCTRAKQAGVIWDKELTDFVYKEAHELRKLRNKTTNIEWHVDHIIPLKGDAVCGLHVWNNFAVIPKVENLRKGNNHTVYD